MDDNKKELIIKCVDNCSCLSIDKWDDEDDQYFLTFYSSYSDKRCFKEKIRDIFKILRGKRIYNTEIILNKEDLDKIKNF